MGIFGKKDAQDIIEEGEDLDDMPSQEAKEIVLVPNQFDVTIETTDKKLLNSLLGKKVAVGSVVWEKKSKEEESFGNFGDAFGDLGGFFDRLKIIVEKTIPEGVVQITDKTKIKIERKKGKGEDIPKEKIIEVAKLPDMKEFMKVKSLKDIIKLAKAGHFVNKYETKSKTTYFLHPYYFEETN